MPAWIGALAAGAAAVIVLAGPAAAPPSPRPSHQGPVDMRHVSATGSSQALQVAFSELELEQFIVEEEVDLGGRTMIELTVLNVGITTLSGTTLRNEVPSGFVIESSDPSGTVSGNTITWALGTLPLDEEIVVTVTLRATQLGTFTNIAAVRSDATNEVSSRKQLIVTNTGFTPGVTLTTPQPPPASGPMQNGELAATGPTLNWILAGALAMVAAGALALEASTRVPAMASLRGPTRRRPDRPVFHPVRSSELDEKIDGADPTDG